MSVFGLLIKSLWLNALKCSSAISNINLSFELSRPSLNSSHTYSLEPPDQFLKDWEIENQGNDTQFSGNYDGSGDGSGSGDDYDYDRPIKYGCHFRQESTGFLLLLRLNFSIMFILPLVVS